MCEQLNENELIEGELSFSDVAADLADMNAIMCDIYQSKKACELYLSGVYDGHGDKYIIRKALYESAFISYRRAFTSGSSRIINGRSSWRIDESVLDQLLGDNQEHHEEIMTLASKCIAHRVSEDAGYTEVAAKNFESNHNIAMKMRLREHPTLIAYMLVISDRIDKYLIQTIAVKMKDR